jgi:O-antigen ligase/polysaccharide polymerase Wzy-like membrane protein
VLPLAAPCGLLIVGAAIGYRFTLDAPVARERLLGLVVTSALAVLAMLGMSRLERPAPLLLALSALAGLGGVWVIAATGPDAFRGTVGALLQLIFRPVFGLVRLTDPVELTNTRFIVGYNGLADLCLVTIFCCGALLLAGQRSRPGAAWPLVAAIGISLIVLIGTGARGGLTGLAAGVCLLGLYAWPRRYALLALVAAPLVLAGAALGILDKGLDFGSTAGRLTYWLDLIRLLVEYPLTGVGLGLDTANRIALQYEINPDPDRIFYAHNTFVQSYLELGPLGALGMLLVPLLALAAALIARAGGVAARRRAVVIAGLGIVGGVTAHGLTDQVVTTNVGTGLLLFGLAAILAALTPSALTTLARITRWSAAAVAVVGCLLLVAMLVTPAGRAQALLNLGGLELNQALALDSQAPQRAAAFADAERVLALALSQDEGHPAVLRALARVRSRRYDDAGALEALTRAAASPRLDAFDMLQIAHLYRDLGFAQEGYTWAARAYAAWGRPPEDAVMQVYAQSTLAVLDDDRARTLATQAEAAMRARTFGAAADLFEQALTFQPTSAYLQDRLGAAQRAVAKYG